MEASLEAKGFLIEKAENGKEALQKLEKKILNLEKETVRRQKVEDDLIPPSCILGKKTTGYTFNFEHPADGKNSPRFMRARTSVIQDIEGKTSGIVTIIHDVTQERQIDKIKTGKGVTLDKTKSDINELINLSISYFKRQSDRHRIEDHVPEKKAQH